MGIQTLAKGIHQLICNHNLPELMYKAFDILPKMVMTPNKAFQLELNGLCKIVISKYGGKS